MSTTPAPRILVRGDLRTIADLPADKAALTATVAASPYADEQGRKYVVTDEAVHSQRPVFAVRFTGEWTCELVWAAGTVYRISAPGWMPDVMVYCDTLTLVDGFVAVDARDLIEPPGGDTPVEYVTLQTVIASIDGKVTTAVEDYLTAHPPTVVTDHGGLTGLDDDDHPQYLTAARGDARYVLPGSLAPVATTGDYASLTGTVPTSALPPLAINTVTVVATQAAMLALTAERGDMAIRTDTGRTYVLASDSPATLADWKEVTAAGQVVSVAGKTGAVTLTKADVGLGSVDNTSDADKPISTATATAITALAPKVNPALTATTPAPVLTTVTTPALSAWTLTGSATYSGGAVTVGPAAGSLSTTIPVTNDTVYQVDLTTSASSGGDVTVTLGAASATYPAAGITSVTVVSTETGTRTLTISGTTWSATITGITVKALTRLSTAFTFGATEARAWSTNTALGTTAHRSLTTGTNNTAVGTSAQNLLTTGTQNTAAGASAHRSLTTGAFNTAVGSSAQRLLTTGGSNTGIGVAAQYCLTTGGNNTGVGALSQWYLTSGTDNAAAGANAQYNLTTGAANTALGANAQHNLTTGTNNVAVGYSAQFTAAGNGAHATTSGARQTSLGVETGQSVTTPLNDITTVGYRARAGADFGTAVGSGAHAAHLRSVALGSTTTTTADDQVMVGPRDVEISDATRGVILRSPNGTRYRITVTDAGALTVSAV